MPREIRNRRFLPRAEFKNRNAAGNQQAWQIGDDRSVGF
jgi:hypothetical protein